MSDQETRAATMPKPEATLKQLLRRAAKRTRPSQVFSVVPHTRETDANREFAPDRDGDAIVWFLIALPIFVIVYAISVKIGAI
ncbi:Flp pilus assembly protein TadG [Bradyrhizobium sp. LB1.3]